MILWDAGGHPAHCGWSRPAITKKGRPLRDGPFRILAAYRAESEHELDRHLDDSMTLLVRGRAVERVIHLPRCPVEAKAEVRYSIVGEGPLRMVHEVVPVKSELQGFTLSDPEVLEEPQIGV